MGWRAGKFDDLSGHHCSSHVIFICSSSPKVGGHAVPTSREAEPISLQLTCNDGSPFSHAFPKNLTIGELRLKLEVISGIQVDNMQLSRVITKGTDMATSNLQLPLFPTKLMIHCIQVRRINWCGFSLTLTLRPWVTSKWSVESTGLWRILNFKSK